MPLALSALDLVPLVEGGTSVDAMRGVVELARAVEALGFTRLWYAEHHNMPGIATTTPEILIAHVGTATSRIRLGAGGVMLPNHSALKVAEAYKMLEALHPGRIDLGLGRAPGTDQLTAFALRRSRQAMGANDFPEQLGELVAWGGGAFPDEHPFKAVRAMPDDRALPPIYILGSSDYGAKMAAELGLGFAFAGHFSQDPPERALRDYRARFQPVGALDRPHAILALSVFCAETEDAARRLASSIKLSFVQLRTGRPRRMPRPDEAEAHVFTPEEQALVSFYENLAVIGTPAQVRARIEALVARTGADEVMVVTHAYDVGARIHSYELIAQAFGIT
ncbi:MAG TPA: LLM class flavin-dependent oxidoreductase [Polyangia bacterium]|nr:LLM class flavin-dependent oxidoreductase [Polyangia bacterium]